MGRVGWLAVAIVFLLAAWTRSNLIFTVAFLLGLLGTIVHLWGRYSLAQVSYRRRFGARRLFFGEETELLVEVTNAKPLPLAWLRCEDEIPASLAFSPDDRARYYLPGRRHLVNLFSLGWYERVTRRYRIQGNRRGAWVFGPVQLVSGDIFGFTSQRRVIKQTQLLLVYPRLVSITDLGLPARHPFGEHTTRRRLADDPLRLSGVRAYLPGDSFRHIHWKVTAHRQDLQTKVFEPSAARPLAIFVNIRTYRHRLEGIDPELREYAISAAASIARWAWERGEAVGVFANGLMVGGQRLRVQPSAHPQQAVRILEALACMISVPHASIERVLQVEAEHLRYGTSVVVISAILGDRLKRVLVDLQRRGFAVTLLGLGHLRLEQALPGVQYRYIGPGGGD